MAARPSPSAQEAAQAAQEELKIKQLQGLRVRARRGVKAQLQRDLLQENAGLQQQLAAKTHAVALAKKKAEAAEAAQAAAETQRLGLGPWQNKTKQNRGGGGSRSCLTS